MKSALFLGAGTSVIAGLPTTAMLMDDLKIKHQHNPIFSFLADYRKFDVERLDAEIETFLNYKDTTILNHEIRMRDKKWTLYDFKEHLKQLRVDIRDLLFEKLSPSRDKIALFQQALEPILKLPIDIQYVFTTNYDILVEEACSNMGIGVIDGFHKRESDLRAVWSNYWKPRQEAIQLLKLHGSVNWWREQQTGNVFKESTVSIHTSDLDVLERPTLIRKSYDDPVLCQLFDRFKQTLQDIDFVIAIGTSFRDKIIVKQLRRSLRKNAMLFAISPDAAKDTPKAFGDLIQDDAKSTQHMGLGWVQCRFGPEDVDSIVGAIVEAIDTHNRTVE